MGNRKWLIVVGLSLLLLAGCNEEEKALRVERTNFDVLDTYSYDKVKPVIEKEKTPQEMAEQILKVKVGLVDDTAKGYPEKGLAKGQGIFVESGILDGSVIPNRSGFSKSEISQINNNDKEEWESELQTTFKDLESGRKKSLDSLKENDTSKDDLAKEIEKATKEQKERIEKQKKAKESEIKGGEKAEVKEETKKESK